MIDKSFGSNDNDFEELIGVQYSYELKGNADGNHRQLHPTDPVTAEAMVELPKTAKLFFCIK